MTLAQVRTIIADPYQFERSEAIGDGVTTQFPVPNAPVRPDTENILLGGAPQVDPTDYAMDDNLGLITFVTAPGVGQIVVATYQFSLLSDSDIDTFLSFHPTSVRRAAADALDTIASSEALIQKRITMLDLQTDGAAIADALRKHAKALRDEDDEAIEEAEGLFDYAEMALPVFGSRNLRWKQISKELSE